MESALLLLATLKDVSLGQTCLISAITGVLLHLGYFIRGYRVPETVRIIALHAAACILLLAALATSRGLVEGVIYTAVSSASYLGALFTSMTVYRVWFHPLRHFPGPLAAKVTKLYNVYLSLDGQMHEHQTAMVKQYGDFVRIAPNELLVVSIEALQKVHGFGSSATKWQTFYEFIHYKGAHNIDSMSDKGQHRWRRRVWNQAMNKTALIHYDRYAREVIHTWLDVLSATSGEPVNTSLYSLLIPFDNMGKMGYSVDFATTKHGKKDRMLDLLEITFGNISKIGQLTWPLAIAKQLDLGAEQKEFEELASRLADDREKVLVAGLFRSPEDQLGKLELSVSQAQEENKEDIMKYLLEDLHAEKPKAFFDRNILKADSQAIMVAGTDTIAAVLSYSFHYLAKDTQLQQSLKEEVAPEFGKTIPGEFAHRDLSNLPLLNAILSETMRMHAPTCNNSARALPPEGITVDGIFIPGGTHVLTGIHAFHRSPKFFKQPDEFIPERWTTRPELVLEPRAFHPFLIGPLRCVGKGLAYIVMRMVLPYTVWHYDFEFAPGEDGRTIHAESANKFILKAGPCMCIFKKRR